MWRETKSGFLRTDMPKKCSRKIFVKIYFRTRKYSASHKCETQISVVFRRVKQAMKMNKELLSCILVTGRHCSFIRLT
jgi:hypothetical protein